MVWYPNKDKLMGVHCAGKQQQPRARVTAVIEPVSPPSGQGHRYRHHQQEDEDQDKKVASIVSGINRCVPPTTLASVEENEKREREFTEIKEHPLPGAVPVIDSSGTSAGARVGAAVAVVAAAPTPPAAAAAASAPPATTAAASAAASGKPSSKSKVASKKAVFGFFRK